MRNEYVQLVEQHSFIIAIRETLAAALCARRVTAWSRNCISRDRAGSIFRLNPCHDELG